MEKYHVLVIEDDIEIANAIKIYLQNQGYDVYVGNDGLEGLEIVEKETIHLAIVDIMMPRMDGLTMVAKLREKYDFPVIFLSAKSEDIDKIMGLNLGGDDYVTKPFRPLELMARVKAQLRRYKTMTPKEEKNMETLRRMLEGKTTAIAGPSGVGKSSIINLLNPKANMETGSISRKIERGKHTTRHSELFMIGEDSYIMDTPGFSSLYVNDFEKEELKYYFPEFELYEGQCRFNGCDHIHEPGCAVKEAVEKGKIHAVRYEDYKELYEELKNKRRY